MPLGEKARAVIDAFGQRANVTGEHEALKGLLDASPLLASKFDQVVEQGLLQRITLTNGPGTRSQYHHDDREMKLNSSMFSPVRGASDLYSRAGDLAGDMQYILRYPERSREIRKIATKAAKIVTAGGREERKESRSNLDRVKLRVDKAGKKIRGAAHKVNKEVGRAGHKVKKEVGRAGGRIKVKTGRIAKRVRSAVGHGDRERNYTDAIRKYLDMKEQYRVDQESARSNVMADAALKAGDAAFNIDAGKRGLYDDFDCRHADAAEIIRWIAQRERHEHKADTSIDSEPKVRIDAHGLGLLPEDIAKHVNNGQAAVDMRYVDKSDGMVECWDLAYEPRLNRLNFDQKDHPEHQLFSQLLEKVKTAEQLLPFGEQIGLAAAIHEGARNNGISITPGDARANLVAALMVESLDKGLVPDAIVMDGQKVFIVQAPKSPGQQYCDVNYVESALKPLDASCRQWDAMKESTGLARTQSAQQPSPGSAFQTKHQMLAPVMQELSDRFMAQSPAVRS